MSPESPYTIGIYLCFCIAQASFRQCQNPNQGMLAPDRTPKGNMPPCQCQNPNQGMLAPDRTPKGTMPPFEVARAYAFERVLVQMEKHVGKSVWELISEDRKLGTMIYAYRFTLCRRAVVATFDLSTANLRMLRTNH